MLRKKNLRILAIETATAACSAALYTETEIIERFEIAPQRHAELILPMINELLVTAGISLQQLDGIAVGQGPGSFMGVRVAVGIAQGLAFGADLPVIPISTLQTLAQTVYQQCVCEKVIVGWDARMQAIYWGVYSLKENIMTALQKDQLSFPQDIELPQGEDWLLAGNAWGCYQQQLTPVLATLPNLADVYPRAGAMIELALAAYQSGKMCSPLELEPVYLRDKVTAQ